MNATPITTAARSMAIAVIIAVAAALGLVVADVLNGRAGPAADSIGDMTHGNLNRAAVSRTASAAFSLDAISAVQAARGDATPARTNFGYPPGWHGGAAVPAVTSDATLDYGLRHAGEQAGHAADEEYVDYGLRHAGQQAESETPKERLAKPTLR